MNKILSFTLLFISCHLVGQGNSLTTSCEHTSLVLTLSDPTFSSDSCFVDKAEGVLQKISTQALYLGSGVALGSLSFLARMSAELSLLSPWSRELSKECFLLSDLCGSAAQLVLAQMVQGAPSSSLFSKTIPSSQYSWYLNRALLSKIPTASQEDKRLLLFLERHWLAKSTGFFAALVDWICPCFGIALQVHPETTSSYARMPVTNCSQTYIHRIAEWKKMLPHPEHFPLLLTRPAGVETYLPSYIAVSPGDAMESVIDRILAQLTPSARAIVDLTEIQTAGYQEALLRACQERAIPLDRLICIQRLRQEAIGGIRLLPFATSPPDVIEAQHQFLLFWISHLGLSASRIELDRWLPSSLPSPQGSAHLFLDPPSKENFLSYLHTVEQDGCTQHPQKHLMLSTTLHLFKQLLLTLPDEKWRAALRSPTLSSIIQLSFLRIQEQCSFLLQEQAKLSFFAVASHVEQMHADLSVLLEIFSPFSPDAFAAIYQNQLSSTPAELKPLTSYGLHASGMTSLAGIFQAVSKSLGGAPSILYGENTYFECVEVAGLAGDASPIAEATEHDWARADLILAQFNPVLKRIDTPVTEYKVEKIEEALRQSLKARQGNPVTLALDCTLDFIDSPRVGKLLSSFQQEILAGRLNVICYRSGLKFDLFGMDNYCGAPFYMIHNGEAKWAYFDKLLTDPALQADPLSFHWFCLAYQHATPQLELYRKQIFANTRALLHKVPPELFSDEQLTYRIIPMEEETDPAFIDIKISGPLHQIRGAALAGGVLFMHCMEAGHPIFYRPSLGFYHSNFTILFSEEQTTIRLTVGLDPAQIDVLAGCFSRLHQLNATASGGCGRYFPLGRCSTHNSRDLSTCR